MAIRSMEFCRWPGCSELTADGYCPEHKKTHEEKVAQSKAKYLKQRASAEDRGYTYRWRKYSQAFLKRPENQICKLHLPGCTLIADCVDHIDPPSSPGDPRFWDKTNHEAACIHCNSVKGNKRIKGEYDMMKELERGKV